MRLHRRSSACAANNIPYLQLVHCTLYHPPITSSTVHNIKSAIPPSPVVNPHLLLSSSSHPPPISPTPLSNGQISCRPWSKGALSTLRETTSLPSLFPAAGRSSGRRVAASSQHAPVSQPITTIPCALMLKPVYRAYEQASACHDPSPHRLLLLSSRTTADHLCRLPCPATPRQYTHSHTANTQRYPGIGSTRHYSTNDLTSPDLTCLDLTTASHTARPLESLPHLYQATSHAQACHS